MSHDSGEENIDPVLQEEIDDGPTASSVGGKRRRTQAATSPVPSQPRKKPAHRSPVWEHFVQQAHDQALANCRYCGQALGCDTVIHGTSAMKNHISRCKLYKMHLESGSQSVLAGDSSGVMTAIKYDQALFRRSVNEMIVLNELSFRRAVYAKYVMKLSVSEQVVPTTGGVVADPGVPASDLYDLSNEDGYERMDTLYSEMVAECTNEECSSELDIYLLEKPVLRTPTAMGLDFDVLSWWGRNSSKFSVLSELARDILAVQVSSVASESAFSTSGRILDPYRSSMSPFMVESLVCTQQWLRNTIQADKLASLVLMFEELQFH